ncbi:ferredoxin reductase family protein [Reinekea marinisedimentorum]|uniref:Putative ferric reductase n=1 Tax=Reinekea marinisedimentorum TaxID=230495 RepID=A0A4R3IA65_9GAMM|nr:ferric reductase-like transmembrane domain-containing protein [Reinekea marinisedimentorum]TCS43319.1 putative ferric reductase [Reinekea marinisedimentorum]
MTAQVPANSAPTKKYTLHFGRKAKLFLGYVCLMVLPFLATYALDMQEKNTYAAFVSLFNTLAMMMFFIQFPLGSRLKSIPLFANIDWNMSHHKKVGQWLGVIFLLHPLLILMPKFAMSQTDGMRAIMEVIRAPQMLTGIIAWVGMIVWILMSIFKDRLPMKYETWRFTHMLGFVAIAILATLHVTTVGQHGQFGGWYNEIWWGLCSFSVLMVLFNYFVKPQIMKSNPFKLTSVQQVSSSDWEVTMDAGAGSDFDFEPGQFVWFNTATSGGVKEHPFSIASSRSSLPNVSFLIRNLGDYTSKLGELKVGQDVFVDGPYGSINLSDTKKSKGVVLIAGGAGIGPMLSLLRGLADSNEQRPVRLIYGNNRADQMVLQDEMKALESSMANFKQQLVCMEGCEGAYTGVIDQAIIKEVMSDENLKDWTVYLCGPKPMIAAVNKSLKALKVPRRNVHFEQLSF